VYGVQPAALNLAVTMKRDFLKKYVSPHADSSTLDKPAFEKFKQVCDHMEAVKLPSLKGHTSCQRRTMTELESVLYRARSLIAGILGEFSEDDWFDRCKNSQGASIGVPYIDTTVEKKFTFPISMTCRVKKLMDRYLTYDREIKWAIDKFNGYSPFEAWYNIVSGSRATTVPKNAEINRMIAIEPTGNMFFQQGLMVLMYEKLANFGLDVRVLPEMHKLLARLASLDGRNATIDWSSASDCVFMSW